MSAERTPTETKPERFGALARLPLFFALKGKRAVIAGGSPAAAWKAELVSATGARADVYAGDACNQLSQLATEPSAGKVVLHRRAWTAADLSGAALAIGDFRDDGEAAAFAAAARAAGVPVNVIDKPAYCDFSFGAIVNRSPLVIGISTDGAAPALARAIRGKIEALLPQGICALDCGGRTLARRDTSLRPFLCRPAQILGAVREPRRGQCGRQSRPARFRPLHRRRRR